MTIVRQILQQKGNQVWSVTPNTTLRDTLKIMADKKVGAVLVIEKDHIEGIFSERDFVREIAQAGEYSLDAPIHRLMTRLVYYIPPDISVDECMVMMTEKRIRHLPVVEEGHLIGIISIGDVVKEVLSQKEITIRSMESYILGRGYNQ